jgi:hypothetical protein
VKAGRQHAKFFQARQRLGVLVVEKREQILKLRGGERVLLAIEAQFRAAYSCSVTDGSNRFLTSANAACMRGGASPGESR